MKKVTISLGVSPNTTPNDLADALKYELCPTPDVKKDAETPDQFRVDGTGLDANLISKHDGGFALLVLEDLDVNVKSLALTKEEEKLDYKDKQRAVYNKLGKAGAFLYYLAQSFYRSAIVMVTTANKDIAFALHHAVNAGKCGIAKSLVADTSRSAYAMTIDEKDYEGFGWDAASKIDLLESLFPGEETINKIIIKDVVTKDADKSIRDLVDVIQESDVVQDATKRVSTLKTISTQASTESTISADAKADTTDTGLFCGMGGLSFT